MQQLLDFDVAIEPLRDAFRTHVIASPQGEARADFDLPFTDKDLTDFTFAVVNSIGMVRRKVRRIESQERRLLEEFGGRLFQAVFSGPVRECLERSRHVADVKGAGLRIRLRLPPALANIPWEFLYDEGKGTFVGLNRETPLVRYLELPAPARPFPISPPLRIMALIPAPVNAPELRGDEEWDKLNDALGDLSRRGMVQVDRLEAGTLAAMQRPLRRHEYHVLHFIGHGTFDEGAQDGALALEDPDRKIKLATGRDLGMMLRGHRSLRLVVLNACEGARSARNDPFGGVAQVLVRLGIPAVVAMQYEISDPAALLFSQSFYEAIADGTTVDVAMVEARMAMCARGHEVEWATPVLYLHSPDGRVFIRDGDPEAGIRAGEDIGQRAWEQGDRHAQQDAELRVAEARARSTGEAGDAATARDQLAALVPERARVSGASHPDTLTTRADLAIWTGETGNAAAARDQLTALLPARERILGAESPHILYIRAALAIWTGQAGNPAAARGQLRALVPARERVLGAEHPDTLTTRADLAIWTAKAGDAAAARDQLEALLPARERILGAEHPDTLTTREELAHWTGITGDAAAARDQLKALLPVSERVRGAEHLRTLYIRADLAQWTGGTGDAAAARDQLKVLLPVSARALDADHPGILYFRALLSNWTGMAGDAAAARDQFKALLPVSKRVHGADHPRTLWIRAELAQWIGATGATVVARDQLKALLPEGVQALGAEHPTTLHIQAALAQATGQLGNWTGQPGNWSGQAVNAAAARDQLAALLPVSERVFGDEDPVTLITRACLASWTGQAGNAAAARDQLAALVPVRERVLGAESLDTLTTRAELAFWTGQAGNAAAARDQYRTLLPVSERVLGTEHPTTMAIRAELAHRAVKAGRRLILKVKDYW